MTGSKERKMKSAGFDPKSVECDMSRGVERGDQAVALSMVIQAVDKGMKKAFTPEVAKEKCNPLIKDH